MKEVCHTLQLPFGWCEEDTQTTLKEKGVANPTKAQLTQAIDQLEHHMIVYPYKADIQTYGTLVEQIENIILQKKDMLSKSVND